MNSPFGEHEDMGIHEFLNRQYQKFAPPSFPDKRPPVIGPGYGVAIDIRQLLTSAETGIKQFGPTAFALLINPLDYARMELLRFEEFNMTYDQLEEFEGQMMTWFGCVCQQALFIPEGTYMVIDEQDYWELQAKSESL